MNKKLLLTLCAITALNNGILMAGRKCKRKHRKQSLQIITGTSANNRSKLEHAGTKLPTHRKPTIISKEKFYDADGFEIVAGKRGTTKTYQTPQNFSALLKATQQAYDTNYPALPGNTQ